MKRGQSYITITDANYSHPIIKKLKSLGVSEIECIYAPRYSSDAGWTVVGCTLANGRGFSYWLGFTKREAIAAIDKITELKK